LQLLMVATSYPWRHAAWWYRQGALRSP
jgi:hypothetical protein